MPFNGSGTYTAPSSPGSFKPAVSGSTGQPTDWNALLTDIESALSNMICRDGQSTVTGDIAMGGNKITGLGPGTADTDSATVAQVNAIIGRVSPTGTVISGYWTSAPSGFLLLRGGSIGKTSSGASERANDDTRALFTLFWNMNYPVIGGRGGSANGDFDAGKLIALPDHRGRVMASLDSTGGTLAYATWPGEPSGAQYIALSEAQMPAHNHGWSDSGHGHSVTQSGHAHGSDLNGTGMNFVTYISGQSFWQWTGGAGGPNALYVANTTAYANANVSVDTGYANGTVGSKGSSQAHGNVQPTIAVLHAIAL